VIDEGSAVALVAPAFEPAVLGGALLLRGAAVTAGECEKQKSKTSFVFRIENRFLL